MPNWNQVTLVGRLTKDTDLRYLPSNTAVCALSIAINRFWRNQQGEKQEETTFIDCEAFAKTAELIHQHLRKGSHILIVGRLRQDQWTDKEGQNRSKLKVIVESFQFIDSRPAADAETAPAASARSPMNTARSAMGKAPVATQTHQPVGEEDIPF